MNATGVYTAEIESIVFPDHASQHLWPGVQPDLRHQLPVAPQGQTGQRRKRGLVSRQVQEARYEVRKDLILFHVI